MCLAELAKELFPPLGKSGKGLKKALFPRHKFTFPCQEIKSLGKRQILLVIVEFLSGTGCRPAGERGCGLRTLGTVVLCLFAEMKSLCLDRKGSLSVCAEHFSTSPWWLSPSCQEPLKRSSVATLHWLFVSPGSFGRPASSGSAESS